MATTGNVKVTVLKTASIGGAVRRPGETVEVPADRVARLVERKLVEQAQGAGGGVGGSASQPDSAEAINRIGAALSVERRAGESDAEYTARVAAEAELLAAAVREWSGEKSGAPPGGGEGGRPSGPLPEDFPGQKVLVRNGVKTWEQLVSIKTREELESLDGIGEVMAERIIEATTAAMKSAQGQ